MRTAVIVGAIAVPLAIVGVILAIYFGTRTTTTAEPEKSKVVGPGRPEKRTVNPSAGGSPVAPGTRPNIIVFLSDDTGYADFWTFGNPLQEYNEIDQMAAEGMVFTQWTAGDRACSPSRAALLTGQYPVRNGIYGDETVFAYDSAGGLPDSAVTIAQALRDENYATGMVGKWHLGCNKNANDDGAYLPSHYGFDSVKKILPFSEAIECNVSKPVSEQYLYCYLYENETIIEQPINLTTLSQRLLDDAKDFIEENKEGPFFLYYAFPQTHKAMFCDPRFCGNSRMGGYGDDINEMAWALGETIDHLKDLGIDNETLSIYISDNGPADNNCYGEGSSGVFRGGKLSTWEGGLRVPAIARWPGTIPANTISHNMVNTMDIWPTALYLATGNPTYAEDHDITLDGQLIPDILQNDSIPVREIYYYYCSNRITAIRYGDYKINYASVGTGDTSMTDPSKNEVCYGKENNMPDCWSGLYRWDPPLVFDLLTDPGETMMLDTGTEEMQEILNNVNVLLNDQVNSMPDVPSELAKHGGNDIVPCCDSTCQCNFTAT